MVAGSARRLPILVVGLGVLLVLATGTALLGPRLRDVVSGAVSPPHTTPSTTAPTGSAASGYADPTGSIDDSTRRVIVNGASMVLPADPFDITPDPVTVTDVFDVCFLAEAAVHPRTRSAPGWAAMVGLAHLDPALESRLDTNGPAALQTITAEFFGSYPTTLTDVSASKAWISGQIALRITATVHYQVKGLASTHDEVTAIVVRLGDGGTVVAMVSIPNDTPHELRRMAVASLATLTLS